MTNQLGPDAPATSSPRPTDEAPLTDVGRFALDNVSSADMIATLTALRDGIDARLKLEKARLTENLLGAGRNQSIPTTRFGALSFKAPTRPVVIDDEKLLEYVRESNPEAITVETREVIAPEVRAALVKDVIDVGDGIFVRGSTGGSEVIDYAYLGEETSAQVAWPASSEQKLAKAHARKVINEHIALIAGPLLDGDATEAIAPRAPRVVVPALPAPMAIDDDEEF